MLQVPGLDRRVRASILVRGRGRGQPLPLFPGIAVGVRQNCIRRPAINLEAAGFLIQTNLFSRIRAYFAVGFVHGVAKRFEAGLQVMHGFALRLLELGPRCREIAAAPDPVGEVADKQGVKIRWLTLHCYHRYFYE